MLQTWYAASCLAIEANSVVRTRLTKLYTGTLDWNELDLMVSEKVMALSETVNEVAAGATLLGIIEHYRDRVSANAERLSPLQALLG